MPVLAPSAPTYPASCQPLPFHENTCPVLGFRSAAEPLLAVELVPASATDADPALNDSGAPEAAMAAVPLTAEF